MAEEKDFIESQDFLGDLFKNVGKSTGKSLFEKLSTNARQEALQPLVKSLQIQQFTKPLTELADKAEAAQKAGMAAMKKLTKRSKGSDMYVDKMTGRSKVKPSAATVGKDKQVSVENYAQKSADRHKNLMKQARSDMNNATSHSDMIKHMNKYQAANKAYDRATRGQFDEISNAKMGQYVRKAADDAARKASKGDVVGARQRVKGVNKAMDKIDKNRLYGRQ